MKLLCGTFATANAANMIVTANMLFCSVIDCHCYTFDSLVSSLRGSDGMDILFVVHVWFAADLMNTACSLTAHDFTAYNP